MPKLLFTVTIKDCEVQHFCAGGKGGQHQNRKKTATRIIHKSSGAVGEARDSREQLRNTRNAFLRMAQSRKFQSWHQLECARLLGDQRSIEQRVNDAMEPQNLLIEAYDPGTKNS